MRQSGAFATKEVAVLSGLSEKAIRHEMARDIASPDRVRVGKATRRRMGPRDVYYLSLVAHLPVALRPEDRRDLYELVRRRRRESGRWQASPGRLCLHGDIDIVIDTSGIRHQLARRLRDYRHGRRRIVSDPNVVGGEPVFVGSRIPVRHIGMLAEKGVPAVEILEDYPSLGVRDVAFARLFVALRPDPGRPRKPLEVRRSA